MKLLELDFQNADADWGFEKISFCRDTTLLVGASGVGKTRILQAIYRLRNIASGGAQGNNWGLSWTCKFLDANDGVFTWTGTFERRDAETSPDEDSYETPQDSDQIEVRRPRLTYESLVGGDGTAIFVSDGKKSTFKGRDIGAKLTRQRSLLSIFGEELTVLPAKEALSQILLVDEHDEGVLGGIPIKHKRRPFHGIADIDSIRNSAFSTFTKLTLAFDHHRPTFDAVIAAFRAVFPDIENVTIDRVSFGPFTDYPILKLKEKGCPHLFTSEQLSGGMRRTLMHLARLALWPDGTLILIDEFENSLGVNCIDAVAQNLLGVGSRLQFIITSHHPYIINTIPVDRWRVIARDRGDIRFFTPDQLRIGYTRHSAFGQLINTPTFRNGTLPTPFPA